MATESTEGHGKYRKTNEREESSQQNPENDTQRQTLPDHSVFRFDLQNQQPARVFTLNFSVFSVDSVAIKDFFCSPEGAAANEIGRRYVVRFLCGSGLYSAWKIAKNELFQLNFCAGIIDINANKIALGVVIEHYAFRHLFTFRAGLLRKIDV
jgi:hypothetical protein